MKKKQKKRNGESSIRVFLAGIKNLSVWIKVLLLVEMVVFLLFIPICLLLILT